MLQIWVCLICVISTCSNGAVQIRVSSELTEFVPEQPRKKNKTRNEDNEPTEESKKKTPIHESNYWFVCFCVVLSLILQRSCF